MKTNNKKGFTLVELIAVIAILALVITIATISIITIRRNINESQRENLQASIVVAAESYHEETGVNIVPVGTLLQIGKLKADTTNFEDDDLGIVKGDPVILDPVSKAPINCDGVVFKNGEGTYTPDIGCSKEAIVENSLTVKYATDEVLTKTSFKNYPGDWLPLENETSNLVLTVLSPEEIKAIYEDHQDPASVVKLKNTTWRVSDAPDAAYEGEIYTVQIPESGKVDMEITVSGTLDGAAIGEVDSDNSEYVTKTFTLKVDARYPSIEKYFVQEGNAWTSTKNVYADIYDGESGIAGWDLVKGTTCTDDSFGNLPPVEGTKTVYKTVSRIGDYTVCVKDNAGHVTSSETAVKVENVDTKPPVLSLEITDGDKWKKTNSFRVVLEDKNYEGAPVIAGFNAGQTATFKYMWSATPITSCAAIPETNKVTFNLTNTLRYVSNDVAVTGQTGDGNVYACPVGEVKDQAGNILEEVIVSKPMKLDNTGPECTGSDTVVWNNPSSKTITISYKDIHSGCGTNKTTCNTSQTYTTTTKSDTVTVADNLGNTSVCSFDVKLDKTAPICGTSGGASTTWTNANRTINQACSDGTNQSGCTKDTYSQEYKTTTKTSSITIEDNAGNTQSCSFNVYVDKTKPICGTAEGASTTWASSRTIKQYCSDGTDQSGCTSSYYSNTYNTTTKTASTTIQDNAGNSETCTYNVYVDRTSPTSSITVSSTNSNYNANKVNITVSGSDADSGVVAYCYSTSSTSCSSWSSSNTFNNVSTGKTDGSGASVTFYGYTKDAVGNISSGAAKTYTLYSSCTKTTETGRGSFGACSKACDGGTQTQAIYYKDTYLGTTCPDGSYTQSCNTRSCCTSSTLYYVDGTTCSASCGPGTYNRKAYSSYDHSVRCSSYDQSSGGASCNLGPCCSTGTYSYYDCTSMGYKRNRKWNECTNQYDYQTTSSACASADYACDPYGACSTSCGSGTKTRTCYYYYGGQPKSYTQSTNCVDESGCEPISCGLFVYKRSSTTLTCYWSPSSSDCYWNSIWGGTRIDNLHAYWSASINVTNPQDAGTCGGNTQNGSAASNHVAINNGSCQYACGGGTRWCNC